MTEKTFNMNELADVIAAEVQNRLQHEVVAMIANAKAEIAKKTQSEVTRERITLTGTEQYYIEANSDGLSFCKKDVPVLTIGVNGQMSTNTRSPRSVGKGSAHFKSGTSSEAIIPSSGNGSTRGIIVEGDGDDDKTYSFRAVSRQNRQGFNVASDGSIQVANMKKMGKVSVYNNELEAPGVHIHTPSKDYTSSSLTLQAGAAIGSKWNHISAISDAGDDGQKTETFRVNGQGDVMSSGTVFSNLTGFAEMFEWADQNAREETRYGFTVSLDQDGKIMPAGDDDIVIGVVVPSASLVGNAFWNHWHKQYKTETNGAPVHEQYELVEWTETETTLMKSFYTDSLPANYALPDNACEVQTDEWGDELMRPALSEEFEQQDYTGRNNRPEWATVCLLGTVPVYKGQNIGANWINVKTLSDELDLMIIK